MIASSLLPTCPWKIVTTTRTHESMKKKIIIIIIIIYVPSTSESSCFSEEGSLHLNVLRCLTEWIPTNGFRPNVRLSRTRMLIGGEYTSSTGKF